MKRLARNKLLRGAILILAGAIIPWAASFSYYYIHVLTIVCIMVLLGASMNVILGYAGQISIGHAGFYAVGAYTAGLLAKAWGVPFPLALLGGALLACVIGLALGSTCLRLSGPYLAIVTVAFGWIVQVLLVAWAPLTGGGEGLMKLPRPEILGLSLKTPLAFYIFTFLCTVAVMLYLASLGNSKCGRAWRQIKEDPLAASTFGVHVTREKLAAFAASAAVAGFAGGLYAFFAGALFPDNFGLSMSIRILMVAVIGGLGTAWGPVVGAIILTGGFEVLRATGAYQSVATGLIVVLVCVFAPGGLLSLPWDRLPWRRLVPALGHTGQKRGGPIGG